MGNDCTVYSPRSTRSTLNQSAVIQFQGEMPKFRGRFNFEKQSAYNKIERAARQFCLSNNLDNGYVPIVSRLLAYHQHHYFAAFKAIPQQLREKFTENIANLEVQLMDSLYTHLIVHHNRHLNPFETIFNVSKFYPPPRIKFNEIRPQELRQCENQGLNMLWKRKVAVMLILSGGEEMEQVTSKALEVLPIEGSPTRLQHMLSKLYANLFSNKQFEPLPHKQPIIIACNSISEVWIRRYLSQKKYFGFDQRLIKIVPIRNLPVLNESGKLCLNFECKTLTYPEGSAKCIQLLLDHSTQLRTFLKYNKVEYIHVLGCEDESQCPGDPSFIGIATRFDRRMLAKCAPSYQLYQDNMRYVRSQSRLHLLNIKELEYLNDLDLIRGSPVALNSMLFQLSWLLDLIDDYEMELALSRRYHPKEIHCNYYDFITNKPIIGGKCLVFQKDIRDYICTTQKAQLIEYQPIHRKAKVAKEEEQSLIK